jgi:sulfotransferase
MNQVHFMTGLPRSGSTLLTALLNQHKDIYSSHQTDLLESMYLLDSAYKRFESYQAGIRQNAYPNMVNNLYKSFYSDIDKPIVIDKNRAWGTPYNLQFSTAINSKAKFIVTVRPVLEILASFVKLAEDNPSTNYIDISMQNSDFYPMHYRDLNDARCDYLMRPNGEIDKSILAFKTILNPRNKINYHIINYSDLIQDTQSTLDKVYNFLEVDKIKNNLENITLSENYQDTIAFGIPNMHKVKKKIEKSQTNPERLLSEYVINKYANSLGTL